jgi:hypothetical protein
MRESLTRKKVKSDRIPQPALNVWSVDTHNLGTASRRTLARAVLNSPGVPSNVPRQIDRRSQFHGEWDVKLFVTIDLENRYRGNKDLLEACVRDGVLVFNQHVGPGARIEYACFGTNARVGHLTGPPQIALNGEGASDQE